MKEIYTAPSLEIIAFQSEDVITTSNWTNPPEIPATPPK